MASLSRLVSLFVIIITLRRADCGTHAGSQPFPTTPSNKLCLRLCRSVTTQQQKRKGISCDGCIKDCEQRKTLNVPGNENDLLARTQRSVKADNKKKSNASSNCTERHLTFCEEQFNENTLPVCPEVVKLKTCLAVCENAKGLSTWKERLKYESLVKKMNSYPDCVPVSKECNEKFVNNCFQQYNRNATPICPEVKKLRMCISELTGCHAMKHPKFVLSRDILEKHRECFIVNYSRILEVLKKKDPDPEEGKSSQEAKTKQTECLGYSDKKERFPPLHPTPTKVLKVAYRAYSSKEHHYNVSWEPFKESDLASGRNWTHYSLLYRFFNRYNEKEHDMDCVLIPKNKTYFVLKHTPLWSANKEPDKLLSAVVPYPFAQTDVTIGLHEADPLKPSKMPSFMPVFATSKVSSSHYHFKIGATIVGGAFALMFLVLMAYVWRRRRKCRLRYQGPAREPVCNISIPNNSAEAAAPRNPENAEELYYCCYYPENEAFRNEVASTVNRFRMEGYDVIMDAMVSSEISCMGPTRWAEAQIRRASKVLVFLSPGLLKLASDGCEGMQSQDVNRVWVELELLRDTYVRTRSAAKMVCITLPSAPVNSTDTLLWVKVTYKFPDDYVQILRRLNDRPSILPHIRASDC